MRKHNARKLDHTTLEVLRERATQRVQEGESPEVVARVFGIGRTAIDPPSKLWTPLVSS
jgi:hypothetical protein